jgi:plastocyanin
MRANVVAGMRAGGLLLVIAVCGGVIACGGGSGQGVDGTAAAPSADLHLSANGLKFSTKTLVAVANAEVHLSFSNGSSLPHNLSVYMEKSAKTKIFQGDVVSDGKSTTYTFTTPGPGTYFFRCDLHPDMNGTFVVE